MTAANGTPTLHELKSYDMLAISAVFLALSAITVVARIYVRGWMIRSFGWDDWLMMVTWVSTDLYMFLEYDSDFAGLVCRNNFIAHYHREVRDSSPRRCRSRHRELHLDSMLLDILQILHF